jgi:hypothetical protein
MSSFAMILMRATIEACTHFGTWSASTRIPSMRLRTMSVVGRGSMWMSLA